MTNATTKLRARRMILEKSFPQNKVGEIAKHMEHRLTEFSKELQNDKTLTSTARQLKGERFAAKAFARMFDHAEARARFLEPALETLNAKVEKQLEPHGGIDVLVMTQTAATIKDLPPKAVFALARQSLDVARTLAINPVSQVQFGTLDDAKKSTLRGIIEGHVLSDDERAKIDAYRAEMDALVDFMAEAGKLADQAAANVSQIESGMASEPSLEPPEAA